MYKHLCVYACVCIHVCVHMSVCTYVRTNILVRVCLYCTYVKNSIASSWTPFLESGGGGRLRPFPDPL